MQAQFDLRYDGYAAPILRDGGCNLPSTQSVQRIKSSNHFLLAVSQRLAQTPRWVKLFLKEPNSLGKTASDIEDVTFTNPKREARPGS
jgi:hypothetical protein